MHSIIEIDISRTGVISLDKAASTRPCKRMRSLVVGCSVRFHLHNEPRAIAPNQFRADQLARTSERITFEKRHAHNLAHDRGAPYLMHRCSLSISIVLSIRSASTMSPFPVIVVARNIELEMASSVASITDRNSGDIASLVSSSKCRVGAFSEV